MLVSANIVELTRPLFFLKQMTLNLREILKRELTFVPETLDHKSHAWLKNYHADLGVPREIHSLIVEFTQQHIAEFVYKFGDIYQELFGRLSSHGVFSGERDPEKPIEFSAGYLEPPKQEWLKCRWVGEMCERLLYDFAISRDFDLFLQWLEREITHVYYILPSTFRLVSLSRKENTTLLARVRAYEFLMMPKSIQQPLKKWRDDHNFKLETAIYIQQRSKTHTILDWTSSVIDNHRHARCKPRQVCVDHTQCPKALASGVMFSFEKSTVDAVFYDSIMKQSVDTVLINNVGIHNCPAICRLKFHHMAGDYLIVSDQTGHYFRIHHECVNVSIYSQIDPT